MQLPQLVQLADLFAGLAVFSRAKYAGYASWKRHPTQPSLFEWEQEASRNDRVRFHLCRGYGGEPANGSSG